MNILLITPAPAQSRKGNRVTADRWAATLRKLGHQVTVAQAYADQRSDLLVALHAGYSAASVERFSARNPSAPVVVALTGTDLYEEISHNPAARRSLELASRLVVLQPLGLHELPDPLRARARVIYQSAEPPPGKFAPRKDVFEICVLGHLRPVKDPFRTAKAVRLLPASSRIRVLHAGAALTEEMAKQARAEEGVNPRYTWLGDQPRWKALRVLARSRLLVHTSQLEGGANVLSEAIAAGVPVIASRIPGSIGILGADYPGYFDVGNSQALATLLELVEIDSGFYRTLQEWCRGLGPLVEPARECQAWKGLLRELSAQRKETG